MGVSVINMQAYFEFVNGQVLPEQPRQVVALAKKSLQALLDAHYPQQVSSLVVATTCPDLLAPSLGQFIADEFNGLFSKCQIIDLVQGCAGGVSAMILASQLCEHSKSNVLVIQADAANKASSRTQKITKNFGNGSFACLLSYDNSIRGLMHTMSRQYKGLAQVVTVKLGHDADQIIMKEHKDMATDPRKHLGLSMNNLLALKLLKNAEDFFLEFVKESEQPDIMILHQANPGIIQHLKGVFSKYDVQFIDVAKITGNCGTTTVCIALDSIKDSVQNKKVMLCSYGTGGVITAGMWQF